MVSREEFIAELIKEIGDKHTWIRKKIHPLIFLFNECESITELILVRDLLNQFVYIDEDMRVRGYEKMAEWMAANADVPTSKILLAAMSYDHNPDSGQKVLHDLRTFLILKNLKIETRINRLSKFPKNFKFANFETIFIVDEFIGSGKTVISRHKYIQTIFPNAKSINFCIFAGMESSVKMLREMGINVYCFIELKKGISELSNRTEQYLKMIAMDNFESRLKHKIGSKFIDDFSFGYGNAESLIAFGPYNIPNSVFPMFWWPENMNKERERMFIRDEEGFY